MPLLGAVQSTLARSGELRGLASTACGDPRTDSWLVGGGTRPGERLRLLLSNPASTPAVVDVDVFGPKGLVEAPAGDGVAVPAHGQVPLFIDALAPGLAQVVVHVNARTGRVRATMHDQLLRGLYPSGTDDVVGTTAPGTRLVIPGVSLLNGSDPRAKYPSLAGSTSVRVAVPGSEEAVVRVSLLDSAGTVQLPRQAVQSVPGGSVVDVPVSDVPDGVYTAVVQSDVPVVAAARIGRRGGTGRYLAAEFAWAPAVSGLSGTGVVALPQGVRSTLALAPLQDAGGSLQVAMINADGSIGNPATISVSAGKSATLQVPSTAAGMLLSGFTGGSLGASVLATVADTRGELISVTPVQIAAVSATRSVLAADERLGLR
jgi:hypothetical protein